jgi:dipeptidyl aminopeptidase/acylaminoacyl peptidase
MLIVVLLGAFCGFASSQSGAKVPVARTRPYTLDDYFAREAFVAIRMSPDGGLLAIERERPATVRESYVAKGFGDEFSRRSDIWVLDAQTGALIWRTDGKAAQRTSFAATWSPDGRELAFLQSGPTGRTTLAIWHASTKALTRVDEVDVDLTVLFTRNISAAQDRNSHFVWTDDSRLLVAARGSLPSQPLGIEMTEEVSRRRRATWQGQPSPRVWDTEVPTLCDVGVQVLEVSPDGKRVTKLSEGPIVGVSIPPSGTRIALVEALPSHVKFSAQPLNFAESQRYGNKNDLLTWQVSVIDRASLSSVARAVAIGEGAVSQALMPRWSSNAERLAVITGNELQRQGKAGVTLIDFSSGSTAPITVSSLSDAEALAALYAGLGIDHLDHRIWRAPPIPMFGDGFETNARIFSLDRLSAAVNDADGVKVVSKRGYGELVFAEANIAEIIRKGDENRIYVDTPDGISWVEVSHPDIRSKSVVRAPPGGRFAGATAVGDLIFYGDTNDGSFIWKVASSGAKAILARANEHLASILIPYHRRVKYSVLGQSREGVLYLPTVQRFGPRPPVVVTAYPRPRALTSYLSEFSNVSSGVAWRWHTLLAAGFALYIVDFRRAPTVDPSLGTYIETHDLVTSEIMPAIDALKRESGVNNMNLGFAGYSYGGYTALTLLGRTNAFKAISAEVPLANLSLNLSAIPETHLLDCAPAFGIGGLVELEASNGFIRLGGPPYLEDVRLIEDSPLFNLQSAVTPTLLFSGELDFFAPNAEQVYMMLLRKNVPTQLVTYWGENHDIESPGNVRDMLIREIGWFTKYLTQMEP